MGIKHDAMYKTGQGASPDFQTHELMLMDIFGNKACPNGILVIFLLLLAIFSGSITGFHESLSVPGIHSNSEMCQDQNLFISIFI